MRFVNIVDRADGKVKIWQMSDTMYQKLIDAMKPEEAEAFATVSSPEPPVFPNTHVCADCGYEQRYEYECLKCHSLRVSSITFAEKMFGPNWRDCFSLKPG